MRVKNALEPEWEARFEPRSYGFRPGRSCQDAIEAIYWTLNGMHTRRQWILDADLKRRSTKSTTLTCSARWNGSRPGS